MKDQSQGVKALISAAQIQQIRLADASARSKSPPIGPTPASFDVRIKHAASVREKRDDGSFLVLAVIDTKLFGPSPSPSSSPKDGNDGDPYAFVHAAFELRYALPKGFVAEAKDLEEFAKVNAIFNAWPYFREFIQDAFTRMLFPPVLLPLFRVGSPQQAKRKDTGSP